MHRFTLRGTYREMGAEQGQVLRGMPLPPLSPKMRQFAAACEETLAEHAPELLEELDAVAEAGDLDRERLVGMSLTAPFDEEDVPSCSVVAVMPERTADGRTLFGRNYDFFNDVSEGGATLYWTYPDDRYASLGACDIWVGREDGANEAGLCVGGASTFLPGIKPGLTFWFAIRMLLDRCATVEKGLELLHTVPLAGSWTYLLADKDGHAAVVEPSVGGVEVRYPEDGLLVMTNHPLCPAHAGKAAWVPADSHPRYNRLRELLGTHDDLTLENVKRALADHDGLVCSHGAHFPNRKLNTLWSVAGTPGERSLEVAAGHPCDTPYERFEF